MMNRNVNWAGQGCWVHIAKVACARYFLRTLRKGRSEAVYERFVMKTLGIPKLRPEPLSSTPAAAAD